VAIAICLIASACSYAPGVGPRDAVGGDDDDAADASDAASTGLVSRSLVVRYFIDEAASGQAPSELADATASPFPLQMHYTSALAFTEVAGQRGLRWTATGDDGRASAPLLLSKVASALNGAQHFTYELVVDIRDTMTGECRLISIGNGTGTYGTAALVTSDLVSLRLHIDTTNAYWNVAFGSGRVVLHAVVDTSQVTSSERYRLYIDGVQAPRTGGTPPAQGAGLALQAADFLAIGNIEGAGRSFGGEAYYAAIYSDALTDTEITTNAARLRANDDH